MRTRLSIYDHMDQYDEFLPRMAQWLKDGDVVYYEDIWDGIDRVPEAFIDTMAGGNIGKRLVKVNADNVY